MKSSKKALAFALAAAMVVTAFPVTNAEAASTAKLSTTKVTVAAGTAKKQTKSIKVTTPSTWKSVKVKVSSSNKKVATVKASGKTVKVTAVKKGSAKVTVKVTAKKGKKAVSKTLKANVKVVNAGLKFTAAPTDMAVGTEEKVAVKKCPSVAKVTLTSSDETIATVAADGTVKAVKAGKVTITATSDYGKSVTTDINVKKAILKSVKQVESDAVVATVAGDTSAIKPADVKITNTATKATVPVKAVAVSKTDKTQVTITTFTGMTDAKEYTVSYDGVDANFTATDGTVASVGVTKTNVPAGIETAVKMVTKDANGVVLSYTDLDAGSATKGNVSAETTVSNGYVNGTNVFLPSVGNTMTVKVTYHTGTFGTDGSETGNIAETFTITAVDPSAVNLTFSLTIDGSKGAPNWEANSFVANTKVPVNVAGKYLHVRALDEDNVPASVSAYTAESADKSKVLVTEGVALDDTTNGVSIKGVSEGSTYVLIKKDGKTVATLPVTVVAAPVATTLALSQTSVTVVTGATIDETVALTVKDQYGDAMDMTGASTDVAVIGKTSKTVLTDADAKNLMSDNKTFEICGTDLVSETEYGTITLKFTTTLANKSVSAALAVRLVKDDATSTYKLRFDKTAVDTTVTSNASTAQSVKASVVQMVNGGVKTYAAVDGDVTYVVKNAKGEKIAEVSKTTATKTCAAVADTSNVGANETLEIKASELSTDDFTKNLAAGTYSVTATFKATSTSPATSVTGTFTVADTQDSLASIVIVNDNFGTNKIDAALKDLTLVKVYYDGVLQTISTVKDIDAIELTNGGAYLKSVTVMVNVTGTTKNVPVTIPVNRTIAKCAGIK